MGLITQMPPKLSLALRHSRKYSATWKVPSNQNFSGSVVNILHAQPNIFCVAGERLIIQTPINLETKQACQIHTVITRVSSYQKDAATCVMAVN